MHYRTELKINVKPGQNAEAAEAKMCIECM